MKKSKPKNGDLSDSELIRLLKRGNKKVFEEIIKRYQKKLYSYLYRLVRNREEAEDLLQNVFLKIYKHCLYFDESRKFSSWAYRIAHNEAVNFLKRKNNKIFIPWEDISFGKDRLQAEKGTEPEKDFWKEKEIKKEIEKGVEKLPPIYQKVIKLRYFSEYSYKEIGKAIGKPVNTVGTLISRAKKKLGESVKKID